mgnify:CR=1 FL=1
MLTDDQCNEFRSLPVSFNDMVRAIYEAGRASKAAEYADVPPKKFKALYRAINLELADHFDGCHFDGFAQTFIALKAIDNGAYNPKIGGEE